MPRIYISGASGSGKTAACQLLVKKHPEIHFINSSQLLLDLLNLQHRKELKNVPDSSLERIRQEDFPNIFLTYPNLIVDGHLNFTQKMVDCFDQFISVEISPEKILQNRQSEPERERSVDRAGIEHEISAYNEKLSTVASKFSLHPLKLDNNGSIEQLAEKIYAIYINIETNRESKSELISKSKESSS